MRRKDGGGGKEGKDTGPVEKVPKKESITMKDMKGKDKETPERGTRKEPTTSRDMKNKDLELSEEGDAKETTQYEEGSRVLCRHNDTLYYEAKVIAIDVHSEDGILYTVHYQGWNSRHDERIPLADIVDRFLPCTEKNLELARTQMQEAKQFEKKKKFRRLPGIADDKKSAGTDSRSSTPSDKASGPASIASVDRHGGRKSKVHEGPKIEEVGPSKPDIRIEIPAALKEILVDDYDLVTRQMHLVSLPARVTIQEIIKQYAEYIGTVLDGNNQLYVDCDTYEVFLSKDTLIDCSRGVQDFFDTTLGSRLLYKFEMLQHDAIYEEKIQESNETAGVSSASEEEGTPASEESSASTEKRWKPSDTYGFVHLIRLFVNFGSFLSMADWRLQGERSVKSITEHVHRFLAFLVEQRQNYFDAQKDYIVASPEYQKRFLDTL